VDYVDVLKTDTRTLRAWFDGKVALVGDVQQGHDARLSYPDGRTLPGCYAQAAAIDSILRGNGVRTAPELFSSWAAALAGALLSAMTVRRRASARALVLVACLVGVAAAALIAYARGDYVLEPFLIGFSLLVGFALHTALGGPRRAWR
jgi:CHASE2 domain-containing sensor protein